MWVYVLNREKNIENNTSTPFSLLGLYARLLEIYWWKQKDIQDFQLFNTTKQFVWQTLDFIVLEWPVKSQQQQ